MLLNCATPLYGHIIRLPDKLLAMCVQVSMYGFGMPVGVPHHYHEDVAGWHMGPKREYPFPSCFC